MKPKGFALALSLAGALLACAFPGVGFAKDFLIWDPDLNHNSGPLIKNALEINGYIGDYDSTATPDVSSLTDYCAVFICLGMGFFKYILVDGEEVDSLVSYLNNGGNIYMEGGDTWYHDSPTVLHPYFHIDGLSDGADDLEVISGEPFQCTNGMVFDYQGGGVSVDRLGPDPGALAIFENGPDSVYYCGILYGSGTYKTIGVSFEFGGADGVTRAELALRIMNECLRCPPPSLNWDVAVLSIDDPDWWVCPDDEVVPKATVKSFGDSTATNFDVTCEIFDSLGAQIYSQFVTVISLPKDSSQQVSFPTWTVGEKGNYYQVTVYTQLAGDQRTENDTLSMATTTVVPFGTVMGSNTFPAVGALAGITYCDLDGYFYFVSKEDDQVYKLDPDDWSYSLAFTTDNAANEVPYGISWDGTHFWVGHLEQTAVNYFYNRQYEYTGTPTGLYIDMAGVAGQWWAGMDFDSKYTRQVTVGATNGIYRLDLYQTWGTLVEDWIIGPWSRTSNRACSYIPYTHQLLIGAIDRDTLYLIDAGTGLTDDEVELQGLLGGIAGVDFYDLGPCNLGCAYALVTVSDVNNTILKAALGVSQVVNDFATISVNSPSDTIPQDSTVIIGTIANWGTQDQTDVWVYCSATCEDSVAPEFLDSTQVSLLSCEQDQVTFPNKWLPGAVCCYRVGIGVFLPGDENSYNNEKTKKVCSIGFDHDVGVVGIGAPPDTVYVGFTYTPWATVVNLGNWVESFDVECEIAPGYADSEQVILLGSGQTRAIDFSDWTVPGAGTYAMCVTTLLVGDGNPANDSLCKTIWGVVGIEEGLAGPSLPGAFDLSVSKPNPSTATTTISYAIADARHIALRVYDLAGRLVSTLVDEVRQPGFYSVTWDGRDSEGVEVPSGTYFYRLTAADFSATRKLVLVK